MQEPLTNSFLRLEIDPAEEKVDCLLLPDVCALDPQSNWLSERNDLSPFEETAFAADPFPVGIQRLVIVEKIVSQFIETHTEDFHLWTPRHENPSEIQLCMLDYGLPSFAMLNECYLQSNV